MADGEKTQLIYNGACPVCDAGVNAFRDDRSDTTYLDITEDPDVLQKHGLSQQDVQYRVHAVGPDGALVRGIDAAAVLLSEKPGWKSIGKALALPIIRQIGWVAYEIAAVILFRWNKWRGNF